VDYFKYFILIILNALYQPQNHLDVTNQSFQHTYYVKQKRKYYIN